MNSGFRYFAFGLVATVVCCAAAVSLRAAQIQQAARGDNQQSASVANFIPNSDYELKIDNGQFLVRTKGASDWKQGFKINEPIVLGNLDGDRKVYLATKAIKPPKATHMVNPHYPESEMKSGKGGVVQLHVIVDDHGVVQLPVVDASPGSVFSAAAVEVLKKWTFKPATLQGNPVAVLITITMEFRLY